ncbi:urease accessory protein UreD [Scopulibacillus cellulosilyticus]|uniref:Urease accessory protein UreD n=1 Tax=Scopulibacillus cellulosilyticus TaxID=2665665 RepID=A0ABW2PX53_9BACL
MNPKGWQQRISVACGEDNRTHLVENYAEAPLRAFGPYSDPKGLKMRLVQIGEGILQGDHYRNTFTVGANATLVIDTDSYTKIYKAPKRSSSQNMKFSIGPGGTLYYLPDPVIPFAGSDFTQRTTVELDEGSRAVLWDILTPGRLGSGECFQYKRFLSETRVISKELGDRFPLVWDRQCYEPTKADLNQPPFFGEFTHIGNLWIVAWGESTKDWPTTDWIKSVRLNLQERNIIPEPYLKPFEDEEENQKESIVALPKKRNFYGEISQLTCGVLVRVLGKSAEDIVNFFDQCVESLHRQGE